MTWLTIRQAAGRANVSPKTIRRRIDDGLLRYARTAGDWSRNNGK